MLEFLNNDLNINKGNIIYLNLIDDKIMKGENKWWILIIILGIIGIGSIYHSSNLNEYIEGDLYYTEFGLMTQDFKPTNNNTKIHLLNFCFYYDFTKNKGNISFDLGQQNWSLGWINIKFPSTINDNTLDVYTIKNGNKTRLEADIKLEEMRWELSGKNYTDLKISNSNRAFNNEIFVIEFESNLKPNGNFLFINNSYNFLHSSYNGQGNVNFVLGDNYECLGNCISNLENVVETRYSSDRNLKINFIDESDQGDKKLKINALNSKIKWDKTFYMGLGISLIISSFNLLFMLIYESDIKALNDNKKETKVNTNSNGILIHLRRYFNSYLSALMIVVVVFLSVKLLGEFNPIIAAVGALLFSIPIRFFWSSYMSPILIVKNDIEVVNFTIGENWKLKVNRIIIQNRGKSSARNCKGYIVINKNKKRVCWTIPKERPNATINAKDEEKLDFCAYLEEGQFHEISGDQREIPRIIAPTEEKWPENPFDCRNLDGIEKCEILVTANNAEPVKAKIIFNLTSCSVDKEN